MNFEASQSEVSNFMRELCGEQNWSRSNSTGYSVYSIPVVDPTPVVDPITTQVSDGNDSKMAAVSLPVAPKKPRVKKSDDDPVVKQPDGYFFNIPYLDRLEGK